MGSKEIRGYDQRPFRHFQYSDVRLSDLPRPGTCPRQLYPIMACPYLDGDMVTLPTVMFDTGVEERKEPLLDRWS
jgi:hypothetical protein